jgi:bacterioferritin-associated ferredoxin
VSPTNEESVVIICQCAAVSDRSLTEAVASGALSLAHVCRVTNAGRDCGSCVFNIRRVITEHRANEVGLVPQVCSA